MRSHNEVLEMIENKNDLLEAMENSVEEAKAENRSFTSKESREYEDMKAKVDKYNEELAIEDRKHKESIYGDKQDPSKILSNAVMPDEKITTRAYPKEDSKLDFGEIVKVISGSNSATNNSEELRYIKRMSTTGTSVVIPQELSDNIIDIARSESAIFGEIPVVQMDHNNITIATVKEDAKATFVEEGALIPESDVLFEGVTLDGKTLALFVPVSEQLLDSASNLSSVLMNTTASAIANTLDAKLLYGTGTKGELKGISKYETINKLEHKENDYKAIINSIKAIKENNINPTNIVTSTNLSSDLALLTDTTGQFIQAPAMLGQYTHKESNNVVDDEILTYDMESMILGLHKGINVEWGYTNDQFQKIQKGLRVYLRCDLGVVRPKGISLSTKTIV